MNFLMKNKICIVTGANSGIGKEIAIGLALLGAHIVMVCRDAEKGNAALAQIKDMTNSNKIDLLLADLSSQASIRELAKTIHDRYETLDVLINNAGVVIKDRMVSVDGIEMTLATNHLGPFLLTHLLLDLLKASSSARVINVSSAIHKWVSIDLTDLQFERRKYRFMKSYAQSKLLMNIVTFEWARRLAGTGVTFNCVHPGAVKTHLGSNENYSFVFKVMDKLIKSFFVTPKKAAQALIYLATSADVQSVTGEYFEKGKSVAASAISYEKDLAKKVWDISERLARI